MFTCNTEKNPAKNSCKNVDFSSNKKNISWNLRRKLSNDCILMADYYLQSERLFSTLHVHSACDVMWLVVQAECEIGKNCGKDVPAATRQRYRFLYEEPVRQLCIKLLARSAGSPYELFISNCASSKLRRSRVPAEGSGSESIEIFMPAHSEYYPNISFPGCDLRLFWNWSLLLLEQSSSYASCALYFSVLLVFFLQWQWCLINAQCSISNDDNNVTSIYQALQQKTKIMFSTCFDCMETIYAGIVNCFDCVVNGKSATIVTFKCVSRILD